MGVEEEEEGVPRRRKDPDDADVRGHDDDDNKRREEEEEEERLRLMGSSVEAVVDSEVDQQKTEARKLTQILAVAAVSFGACICGTTIVYPAVARESLIASNATNSSSANDTGSLDEVPVDRLPFPLYQDDLAFMTSIPMVGTLFASFLAGPISNFIGRKWSFVLGVWAALASGYVLVATAQRAWMMLLGRFLHGAAIGVSTTIINVYIMEVATPELRGRLAVVPAIAGTLGIIATQVAGEVMSWKLLAVVLAGLNVPFVVVLLFIPESPVYLITTNQIDRAHKVLRILRGPAWNVTKELTDIKVAQDGEEQTKRSVKLRDFKKRSILKPFLIALCLMFFMQFTGINVIIMYTPYIFEMADSSIPKFLATQIFGLALLASNAVTIFLAGKMPRRSMLLLSALGISVTLVGVGVCLQMKANDDANCPVSPEKGGCSSFYSENLRWLPLLLSMLYIFCFSLGYGAMLWMTVVEILPQHVRAVAVSLAGGFACLWGFLTSYTFIYLMEAITRQGVFFLYGIVSVVGLCFIFAFVPETRGKTAAEIHDHFISHRRGHGRAAGAQAVS